MGAIASQLGQTDERWNPWQARPSAFRGGMVATSPAGGVPLVAGRKVPCKNGWQELEVGVGLALL